METELKVGMKFSHRIITEWCKIADNYYQGHWISTPNLAGQIEDLVAVKVIENKDGRKAAGVDFYSYGTIYYFAVSGFMEFAIANGWKPEQVDLKFTKVMIPDTNTSIEVQRVLFQNGFTWEGGTNPINTDAPYLYLNNNKLSVGYSSTTFKNSSNREITVNDILALVAKPTDNLIDFSAKRVWTGDITTSEKIVALAKEQGYIRHPNDIQSINNGIYFRENKTFSGTNGQTEREFDSLSNGSYKKYSIEYFLQESKQQVNSYNSITNHEQQQIIGKAVIVPAIIAAVTRGQEYSGNRVSGRTSRATVTVGYLSNQAISTECQEEFTVEDDILSF